MNNRMSVRVGNVNVGGKIDGRKHVVIQSMTNTDTADAKMKILSECGITVAVSPAEIGQKMTELLGNR